MFFGVILFLNEMTREMRRVQLLDAIRRHPQTYRGVARCVPGTRRRRVVVVVSVSDLFLLPPTQHFTYDFSFTFFVVFSISSNLIISPPSPALRGPAPPPPHAHVLPPPPRVDPAPPDLPAPCRPDRHGATGRHQLYGFISVFCSSATRWA